MPFEWNTPFRSWNHGGLSGDVHFVGHLLSNRTTSYVDKRYIRKYAERGWGARGLGLGNTALMKHHILACDNLLYIIEVLSLVNGFCKTMSAIEKLAVH